MRDSGTRKGRERGVGGGGGRTVIIRRHIVILKIWQADNRCSACNYPQSKDGTHGSLESTLHLKVPDDIAGDQGAGPVRDDCHDGYQIAHARDDLGGCAPTSFDGCIPVVGQWLAKSDH